MSKVRSHMDATQAGEADYLPEQEVPLSTLGQAEEWRKVEGWPYEVSDMGRVRRIQHGKPNTSRKVQERWDGYRAVELKNNGQQRNFRVVRLVLRTFVGEPPQNHVCDHINRIRNDDRLVNLRWVTPRASIQNSDSISAIQSRKTHCKNGHPFSEDNLARPLLKRPNSRRCKACIVASDKRKIEKRRQERNAR